MSNGWQGLEALLHRTAVRSWSLISQIVLLSGAHDVVLRHTVHVRLQQDKNEATNGTSKGRWKEMHEKLYGSSTHTRKKVIQLHA